MVIFVIISVYKHILPKGWIFVSKKIVSLILTLALIISCVFVGQVTVVSAEGVWNGSDKTAPTEGEGSDADPFIITNGAQLAWAVTSGRDGLYFRLASDIYLNEINEDGSLKTDNSWFRRGVDGAVSVNIDGDGHVVYGLYYNDTAAKTWAAVGAALVPSVGENQTAVIKNLGISNSYVNDKNAVSAFIGYSRGTVVMDNCFVSDSVTLSGYETGALLGLSTNEFQISNCYSQATLVKGVEDDSASDTGLLGEFYCVGGAALSNCSVENCYNSAGGGSTKAAPGVAKQVYTTEESRFGTVLTAEQMQGAIYDGNEMLLGDAFAATEGYPVLKIFAENANYTWNGIGDNFDKGDGSSADNAYVIENAGQLALMVATGGNGKYYRLEKDILLNDLEKIYWHSGLIEDGAECAPNSWFTGTNANCTKYNGFTDSISFSGKVDGNGHTIYGLWYDADATHTSAGLIPSALGTTVNDIGFAYSFVSGGRFTGALSSYYGGTVSGCYIDNTVTVCGKKVDPTADSGSVGGILGWSQGVALDNCFFEGNLIDEGGVGHCYGLIGTSWNSRITARNCISIGYQPFTVSMSKQNFASQEDAESYYETLGRYSVTDVYTDTFKKANAASYTLDLDGDGTYETSGSYEMFTFTQLENKSFKGSGALDNLTAISKELWYPVAAGYPMLKAKGNAGGDVNADGSFNAEDKILLRESLIGKTSAVNGDPNTDGTSDITDLVSLDIKNGFVTRKNTKTVCYDLKTVDLEDYTVIYPAGDENAADAAEKLATGLGISFSDDTVPANLKEISIGATNRLAESSVSGLAYKCFADKDKIFIDAANEYALTEAVDNFISLCEGNRLPLVRGTANGFVQDITLSNGKTYSYVWGDEFTGTVLDRSKWKNAVSGSNMGPCTAEGLEADIKVMNTSDVIKLVDGNLRLSPILYTDPDDENIKYAVPASVRSQERMEYRYGYAEIRAKVPFATGVWPSYWTGMGGTLGERNCYQYSVEVDIFEIFGTEDTVVPNLHKWYRGNHDPSTHDCTYTGTHSTSGTDKRYVFTDWENLDNEYHTYGFEWTPTEMSMYVDGYCYKTYDITRSFDECSDMTGFHDPRYIIFNNHVFSPNSSFKPNLITGHEENLPANYDIDYFRLYQDPTVENSAVWSKIK